MGLRRWIGRGAIVVIVAYAAFYTFSTYRAGYFSLPDLPDGAFTLSYKNGFRAIILEAEVDNPSMGNAPKFLRNLSIANRSRKYLSVPYEVQPWFRDAWSWCSPPTPLEISSIDAMPDDFRRSVENARFEAVCKIEVDGKSIVRGLIFSVPRL